jgi:hypothetical protein
MVDIVLGTGRGLCWTANTFTQSRVCATLAHEYVVGFAFFILLGVGLAYCLMKRLGDA